MITQHDNRIFDNLMEVEHLHGKIIELGRKLWRERRARLADSGERKREMNVTEELNQVISENGGSARDALNVTLARLQEARTTLEEIRDLARTDLPPATATWENWAQERVNKIAGMAARALGAGR